MKKLIALKFLFSYALMLFASSISLPTISYAASLLNNWSIATPLPYPIASHVSISYLNKIFVIDGSARTGYSKFSVPYITPDANGNVQGWSFTTAMPSALIWHSIAQQGNHIYVLGGKEENPGSSLNYVSSVFSGTLDDSASITSWQALNPLPQRRSQGAAVIVGNKIYFAGGYDNSFHDEIYYASINSDGTLSQWQQAGTLPKQMAGFGMFSQNNNLIIVGGYSPSSGSLANSYTITINPDGTLPSAWQQTASLPQGIYRGAFLKKDSQVFVFGGGVYGSPATLDTTYYTTVNSDGTLNAWRTLSNLPISMCCQSATYTNGFIYLIGGYSQSSGYLDSVYYTKPESLLDLNVSNLKQTSDPWQSQIYDSANLWSPANATIKSWGCALTSAAMILNYYGINKLIDGTGLDPGTLNTWLIAQNDGYVGDGLINWLAVSRLSKLAKAQNSSFSYDALEYKRGNNYDTAQLTTDLNNSQPDILEEPGHFVVAKGENSTTFDINDPYYDRQTLNDGYSNTFLSLGRYIPSHTNLAYIMLTGNPDIDFSIASSSADVSNYIQQAITDPTTGEAGTALRLYLFPTPDDGNYTISISTTSAAPVSFSVSAYTYTASGSASIFPLSGYTKTDEPATFSLNYSQNPTSSQTEPADTTPPQILSAKTLDTDTNGRIDQIEVKFVRNINLSTVNTSGTDFQIDGYQIKKEDKTSKNIITIELDEKSTNDTGETPLLTLLDHSLKDLLSNSYNHQQTIAPQDGSSPTAPVVDIEEGNFLTPQSITIASSDNPAAPLIYYTLDGSDPATSSSKMLFTDIIQLTNDTTLKAIAIDTAGNISNIITKDYEIAPSIDETSITASANSDNTSFNVRWTTGQNSFGRLIFGKNHHKNITHLASDPVGGKFGYGNTTIGETVRTRNHYVVVSDLTPGITYYYRVISRGSPEQISNEYSIALPENSSSSTSSSSSSSPSYSSILSNTASTPVCSDQKPQSAPKLISAFPGINTVTLEWTRAIEPVSYYLVAYGTVPGKMEYGDPNVGGKDTASFIVQNLSGGTTYYFEVRAGNGCMPGDFSDEIAATPLGFSEQGVATGFSKGVLGLKTETKQKNLQTNKPLTKQPIETSVVLSDREQKLFKIAFLLILLGLAAGRYLKRDYL